MLTQNIRLIVLSSTLCPLIFVIVFYKFTYFHVTNVPLKIFVSSVWVPCLESSFEINYCTKLTFCKFFFNWLNMFLINFQECFSWVSQNSSGKNLFSRQPWCSFSWCHCFSRWIWSCKEPVSVIIWLHLQLYTVLICYLSTLMERYFLLQYLTNQNVHVQCLSIGKGPFSSGRTF